MTRNSTSTRAASRFFSTGRIVCTGAKTKEMVGEAVEKLVEEVKSLGLAMVKGGLDSGNDEDFI